MEMVQPILAAALVLGLLASLLILASQDSPSGAAESGDGPGDPLQGIRSGTFCARPSKLLHSESVGPSELAPPHKLSWWFARWLSRLTALLKPVSAREDVSLVRRVTLTPTHHLHILMVHGEELLLVTHPHGCESLRVAGRSTVQEALLGEHRAQ
jgi:hypothetical protein